MRVLHRDLATRNCMRVLHRGLAAKNCMHASSCIDHTHAVYWIPIMADIILSIHPVVHGAAP